MIAPFHFTRPQSSSRTKQAISSKKSLCTLKEGEGRRERVDIESGLSRGLHVGEPVVQGEGELLNRRRSGFPDVVPTDADRMPFGRCSAQ